MLDLKSRSHETVILLKIHRNVENIRNENGKLVNIDTETSILLYLT
jgi:hypothetical protein